MIDLDNESIRALLEEQREVRRAQLADIEWLLAIMDEDSIELSDPLEVARALRRLHIIA